MKYGKARELVESALEQLDEAAKKKPTKEEKAEAAFQRSLARLSARNAKNQKKYQKAAAANPRTDISAHGRPVTKADVAAWHASKPKRSDGLREPYNYMGEAQLDEAVNAMDLRKKIDLHGNQVKVHSQLYNRTMDTSHRDQAYAHSDAHKKAVKKYKKLTGKEYYGKPSKSSNPVYLKTTAANRTQQSNAAGQPGGMNW